MEKVYVIVVEDYYAGINDSLTFEVFKNKEKARKYMEEVIDKFYVDITVDGKKSGYVIESSADHFLAYAEGDIRKTIATYTSLKKKLKNRNRYHKMVKKLFFMCCKTLFQVRD